MASFEKDAPSVRLAEVRHGDSLRRIALREMGTAAVWADLGVLNGLRPPYIVQTEAERVDGVLVAGDLIKLPAQSAYISATADPDAVFGRDLQIENGLLAVDGADLAIVGGMDNLLQALRNRISVVRRELAFHPDYGNYAPQLKGQKLSPAIAALAALYVKSALLEDDRVASVSSCVATVQGDELAVNAQVVPISGRPLNFSTVI